MGCMFSNHDYESERSRVIDKRQRQHTGYDIELRDETGRNLSVVGDLNPPAGPPRIHRDRTLDKSKQLVWGVTQRSTPLKDCTDELLLAELEHRNIRLHERVSLLPRWARFRPHGRTAIRAARALRPRARLVSAGDGRFGASAVQDWQGAGQGFISHGLRGHPQAKQIRGGLRRQGSPVPPPALVAAAVAARYPSNPHLSPAPSVCHASRL